MSADPDRSLEQLLADTSALRARLREENAEALPPAHLDAAILAASRRAVSARPVAVGGSGLRRWQVPLAAAAVVVLATSVALLTLQEGEHDRVLGSASPRVQAPASEPKRLERLDQDVRSRGADAPSAARRSDESVVGETPLPELRIFNRMPRGDVTTSSPAPMEQRRAAPAAPAPSAEMAAEQDLAALAPQAPRIADRSGPPAERAANAGAAPQAGSISSSEFAHREKLELEKNALSERQQSAEKRARAAKAESPPDELALIRKRWEAGDQAGAREALAAFLQRHPDYPLPSGYPVPRPTSPPAQERPPEDR